MDLNQIKNRLDQLQNKDQQPKRQKIDYAKIFYRPQVGKHQIRIVPSKFDKSNPFKEVFLYYGINNRTMISPRNFGEDDPIYEFTQQLRQSGDKENYFLAKKLDAKMRIFVPVVVRGEEEMGVRLWQFGKQVYQELLALAADEEVGDFTDIVNGRDFTLEVVGPEVTGTQYNKSSVRPRMKQTPLSDNAKQAEAWLEEQPNPLDVFRRYSFDEMKEALKQHLNPSDEKEETPAPAPAPKPEPVSQPTYSEANQVKTTKSDKFDELFSDDSTSDLPF